MHVETLSRLHDLKPYGSSTLVVDVKTMQIGITHECFVQSRRPWQG